MKQLTSRRAFLWSTTLSLAGVSLAPKLGQAIEPFKRSGPSRLLLSLAAYSFRDFFGSSDRSASQKDESAKRLDLFQFIDYCAEHGCQGTELTSYYFPKQFEEEFLLKLRRHAFLRGVDISGTAVGNTFTLPEGEKRAAQMAMVKKWVDHAAVMGAPHVRVFAGSAEGQAKDNARKLCIAALEECAEYAGRKGVFLGLENHGGIVAEPAGLLEIIRAVQSPWVGINLDTGNFHTDDPYADLAACAPYAVNVQVKADMKRRGQPQEPADLPRLIRILRDANYQGYVALEYESKEDPWKAVPGLLKRLRELCKT
jgi:sugar phosphate isomerase/epimerase